MSRSGFVPSVIHARKGEAIHLRVTSEDQEHCFALDAFRIEKRIVPGRTTAVRSHPGQGGDVPLLLLPRNRRRRRGPSAAASSSPSSC